MKHLFDKPPFPGRFVFDIHQPQKIIDDFDITLRFVVLSDNFSLNRVDFSGDHKFTG